MTDKYSKKYHTLILDNDEELLKTLTFEEKTVFFIIYNLSDRRGLKQAWESIDDDIQDEIIDTWIEIVRKQLTELENGQK